MNKDLTASMEDYLEVIFLLVKKHKLARAKDIAQHLGVKKPSVTGALRVLSEKGFIAYAPYGYIDLTPKGEAEASKIFRRHEILKNFFAKILHVDETKAEEDACKVEHSISDATLDKLVEFVHFIEHCPRTGPDWVQSFNEFCSKGIKSDECMQCAEEMAHNLTKSKRVKKNLKLIK